MLNARVLLNVLRICRHGGSLGRRATIATYLRIEMRGYSEHRDEKLSRVRLVQDDDNDGVYDRVTTFADDLLWPRFRGRRVKPRG